MNKKYDEVMEHINVTPEMRNRVLNRIADLDPGKQKQAKIVRFPNIKRFAALAACLAVMIAGAAVLPHLLNPSHEPPVLGSNGIVEVFTIQELSEAVGFEVVEPENLPFEAESAVYTAYWMEMAEIVYTGGEQTAVFRKGVGDGDISGDYHSYEMTEELSIGDIHAVLKGGSGTYSLAVWTDHAFAYSLSLSDGISEAAWREIFEAMID